MLSDGINDISWCGFLVARVSLLVKYARLKCQGRRLEDEYLRIFAILQFLSALPNRVEYARFWARSLVNPVCDGALASLSENGGPDDAN